MTYVRQLKNAIGKNYAVYLPSNGIVPGKQRKREFITVDEAKLFVRGFRQEKLYWYKLLLEAGVSPNTAPDLDGILSLVARSAVNGRLKFIEIPKNEVIKESLAHRTFSTSPGEALVISPASDMLFTKGKQTKNFSTIEEAKHFLDMLGPSDRQLKAMSSALGLPELDSQTMANNIANALHAGDGVVIVTPKFAPKAEVESENAADLPGAKPVEAPPSAESKPAQEAKKPTSDADQAETLIQAAEEGAAFCEDCAEQDEQNDAARADSGASASNQANTQNQGQGAEENNEPAVNNAAEQEEPEPKLSLDSIDSQFAPGVELLDLSYSIKDLDGKSVYLEIQGDNYPGTVVYKRELTSNEKSEGDGKPLTWDGKANTGSKSGKWTSPIYGPFKAKLYEDALTSEKAFNIEIDKIELLVDAPNDEVILNVPESETLVSAKALIKKKDGNGVETPVEIETKFTFTPKGGNVSAADSFIYSPPKKLGKTGDASAIYWKKHPDCNANSADGFKAECIVETKTTNPDQAVAKVSFIFSGVGGNEYKIKSEIIAADATTVLASEESNDIAVWREVEFSNIYTMDSENYINGGTAEANITPAFTPSNVKYKRGGITTLDPALTVKYIGLYDKVNGGSKNWPADFSPANLETSPNQLNPTATELADYNGADPGKKAAAKTAIEAKAQAWFTAIVRGYSSSVSDWFSDANVPAGDNSLLAVQYYHPKLSGQADGVTNFWPAGISINLANPGSGLNTPGHPDQNTWRNVQGFNRGKIVVIFKNYGNANRLQIICRHEIGHATKSSFKRDVFGVGDHSNAGLMTPWGSSNNFSGRDKKVLRGEVP